ncbi:hypothetical protein GCM10012278_61010 [Nonomuraea glycinis]|uniref:Uncharacterized protein n=1 Tax=Nonomuraea glycinis TaxID=2047744 RepID=A0A918A9K5_9ACTN|nr:hypothetical protein GCM10012278_61010 [Nonomuraea glycinis]
MEQAARGRRGAKPQAPPALRHAVHQRTDHRADPGSVDLALAAPEPFELGVEWPAGGIELSIVDLEGEAIRSAVQRSVPYWPDSPQSE